MITGRKQAFWMVLFGVSSLQTAYSQDPPRSTDPRPTSPDKVATQEPALDGDFRMARHWHRSSELSGRPITSDGQSIGKIEDLMVDVNSGRVVYGVGSFDKLQGGSDRLYPVPWPAARFSDDGKTLDLRVNADRLQAATSFPRGEWPNFNDEQFTVTTFRSYDQTPWWQENRARTVTLTADKDRSFAGNDARWSERPTSMQRMSELRGREIRGADGKQIGQIGEVVFDPESGRILYAIDSSGGRNVPIPWRALQASDKSFQLNLTAEQWEKAPHFETDRWPDVADQQWAENVHRYYAVDPYWDANRAPRGVPSTLKQR